MIYDVVCVIDPRFEGGTAAALASDVGALLDAGRSVGLVEVTSPYLGTAQKARSKTMARLCADTRLQCLDHASLGKVTARTTFLHHPMTFFYGLDHQINIEAQQTFLVAHHLPFRGDGSLQYDPVATTWRARGATGTRPVWAPVSGICRQQLQSFRPLIRLASQDWPNVFDVDDWVPKQRSFSSRTLTVGRHGRADPLKWPESAADIAASLPNLPGTEIRVMGAPLADFQRMGVDLAHWDVLAFDAEPVAEFLDQLDVFVYHFHPDSSESFGRTVAEAMLMGAVCILDPRLEPTFGDLAIYCPPVETAHVIEKLRADPVAAQKLVAHARATIAKRHAVESVPDRLDALMSGTRMQSGDSPRTASPAEVLRKTAGMIRRGEYFLSQLGKEVSR